MYSQCQGQIKQRLGMSWLFRKRKGNGYNKETEGVWRAQRPRQNCTKKRCEQQEKEFISFARHAKEINTHTKFHRVFHPSAFYKTCAPEGHSSIICRSTTANKSQTCFSCCLTQSVQKERCFTVKPQPCKRSLRPPTSPLG